MTFFGKTMEVALPTLELLEAASAVVARPRPHRSSQLRLPCVPSEKAASKPFTHEITGVAGLFH